MIVNTIANYNVNASSYNATTGIWQFSYNPTPLATGIWCGTLSTTGGVLPTGYSLTAVYFLFFYSGAGGGFGLADSYANALAEVPVIFTTGGTGSLVFKKQGGNYTLQARVPECCDEPYFNREFGVTYPDQIPATITFVPPTFTRGTGPLPYGWTAGEMTALLDLMSQEVVLNLIIFKLGQPRILSYGIYYTTIIEDSEFFIDYSLVSGQNGEFAVKLSPSLKRVIYGQPAPLLDVIFYGNISSWDTYFSSTGVLIQLPNYFIAIPTAPATFEITDPPLAGLILPATLTLTKKPTSVVYATAYTYPTRGWTTNNYTSELPNSITLSKVAGYNSYEAEFNTAVNVKNYIRIKLVPSSYGWKYADYEIFSVAGTYEGKYLGASEFLFDVNVSGTVYAPPINIVRDADDGVHIATYFTEVSLFRMEGIPLLTSSGYVVSKCKGFANYYLENPGS